MADTTKAQDHPRWSRRELGATLVREEDGSRDSWVICGGLYHGQMVSVIQVPIYQYVS